MAEKFNLPRRGKPDWFDLKTAVLLETDAVHSTIGGPYLVLRADMFLDHLLFDADRFAGQETLIRFLAVQG